MFFAAENPNPENPSRSGENTSCNETKETCGCKPIISIEVISMSFLSDHELLKNEETSWTNNGAFYPKPDWFKGRAKQSPVSYSMGKPVKLKVVVNVKPDNACHKEGTLECAAPEGLEFKPQKVNFKNGENTFYFTSTNNLPEKVQKLDFKLNWTAKSESKTFSSSTQNELFVTMGKPLFINEKEDGATYKRIAKAVELVGKADSADPTKVVDYLMTKLVSQIALTRNEKLPKKYDHPSYLTHEGGAWAMADYIAEGGECQAIVRFLRGLLTQVGCPGNFKAVVIWTDMFIEEGKKVLEAPYGKGGLTGEPRKIKGVMCKCGLVAAHMPEGNIFSEKAASINSFEACLKFTYNGVTKYYGGGGDKAYNSREDVITIFDSLICFSLVEYDKKTKSNICKVEKVVREYR